MSDFSISEVAFSGFRFAREKPQAIIIWAVLSLIMGLATVSIMISTAGPMIMEMQAMQGNPNPDPAVAMAGLGAMLMMYLYLTPVALIYSAVIVSAATRGVVRPEAGGPGFLRLGGDELRMLAVMFVIGLLLVVAYMVTILVFGIIGGIVMMAMSGGAAPEPGAMNAATAVMLAIIMVPTVIVQAFLATKFSLAPSLTLASRSINIFGSWSMLKGRTGRAFLAYLVAFLLYMVVALLGFAIFAGVAAALGQGEGLIGKAMQPDLSSFEAYFTPLMIIYQVVMAFISALGLAILLCPPATLFKTLTAEGMEEVF